jgi:hypothetical protein
LVSELRGVDGIISLTFAQHSVALARVKFSENATTHDCYEPWQLSDVSEKPLSAETLG